MGDSNQQNMSVGRVQLLLMTWGGSFLQIRCSVHQKITFIVPACYFLTVPLI